MLYDEKYLKKKAAHIARLFPRMDWSDLFELIPQIMEVTEAVAIVHEEKGPAKREAAVSMVSEILNNVHIVDDRINEAVPLIIDLICDASKGKFAINKE